MSYLIKTCIKIQNSDIHIKVFESNKNQVKHKKYVELIDTEA